MAPVQGYASIFGNVDSYEEIVDAGAFADWIVDNPGKQVPLLWMHDRWKLPVGLTSALSEDNVGLRFAGDTTDTSLGEDVVKLIDSGAVRSASFAYRTRGWEVDDDGIWHLTKLDLIEVSAVTTGFGANDKAFIELATEESDEPKTIQPAGGLSAADINAIFAKHWRLTNG